MKHMKTEIIPETKKDSLSHTTCDICGGSDESIKDNCDFDNVEIEYNDVDHSYPECGSGTKYTYDICEECFVSKVIPSMLELGATPHTEDWDY